MKIMTVLGTRPEIIRLSLIMPLLNRYCTHIIVNTGQNFDHNLNDIFFSELGLRNPDYTLKCKNKTLMGQIASILTGCEQVIETERPDRLLILGDTNSALAAMVAKRMGIPVFHMEAGNRCFDDRVPEEVNRRVVDHCSDILLPYTERSRANLLREGVPSWKIYVTGNPIKEVLESYTQKIDNSRVLQTLGVQRGDYFLITLHRSENVDIKARLSKFIEAFNRLHAEYKLPVICSLHPRTCSQIKKNKIPVGNSIIFVEPLGLFDFVQLEKNACCVLSDSGTVQEECCIYKIPNVTLRDVTERPETVEAGSNIIAGCEPESILKAVKVVSSQLPEWNSPPEYLVKNVSNTVVKLMMGEYPWMINEKGGIL